MRTHVLLIAALTLGACRDEHAEQARALEEQMRVDALARAARSAQRACESERLALVNELATNEQYQANLRNELAVAERDVAASRAYAGGPNEATIAIHESHVLDTRNKLATAEAEHGVLALRVQAKSGECQAQTRNATTR